MKEVEEMQDFDLGRLDEIPDVIAPAARGVDRAAPQGTTRSLPIPQAAGRTRAQVRRDRALALAGGLVWLAAQVALLGLRTDLQRLGTAFVLAQIALPAALGAALLVLALWPGRDALGAPTSTLTAATVLGLAGMTGVVLLHPLPFPYAPPPGSMTFGQWALVCGDIVAMMGAAPLALAAFATRRSFAAAAPLRTAALGGACALGAVTAMHLHCENIEPAHVALGHMVPAIALTLVAAFLVQRLARA